MKGTVAMIAVWFVVVLVVALGWVKNLINVINAVQSGIEVSAVFLAQLVGVFFAPLGALLGYLL